MGSWRLKLGIVLAVVAIWVWGFASKSAVSLFSAKPRRGSVAEILREEGRTRYRVIRTVSMPFSGRLLAHSLEEGNRVEAGQALVSLQANLPQAAVQALDAELEALQVERDLRANVSDEEALVRQEEARHAAARAQLRALERERKSLRASLELARKERSRILDLSQKGSATKQMQDQAETSFLKAQAAQEALEARLAASRAEVEGTQASAERARIELARQGDLVRAIEARMQALEARRIPLADDQSRTTIPSPLTGEILRVFQKSEALLPAGSPLFEVGDPTSLEFEVDLLSEDAVHFRPDGLYSAFGRALGLRELPLRLREVSPLAFAKRSSLGVEEQRVHAWFQFQTSPPAFGHGYRLHLRAALEVARDALLVPRRAMVRSGPGWGVFLARQGRAAFTPVTPGVGDESWVAIEAGIAATDQVLLDAPEDLEDSDPILTEPAIDLPDPSPLPGLAPHSEGSER